MFVDIFVVNWFDVFLDIKHQYHKAVGDTAPA